MNRVRAALSYLIAVSLVLFAVLFVRGWMARGEVPEYNPIGPFELVNQNGEKISLGSLEGKVWVASFLFTHCPSQCPLIVEKLKTLAPFLKEQRVWQVTFSLDPANDTPEVLRDFALRQQLDTAEWYFLTGPTEIIQHLMNQSFHLSAQVSAAAKDNTHTTHLVLVDGKGMIRGYYDALDSEKLSQLKRDVGFLAH